MTIVVLLLIALGAAIGAFHLLAVTAENSFGFTDSRDDDSYPRGGSR